MNKNRPRPQVCQICLKTFTRTTNNQKVCPQCMPERVHQWNLKRNYEPCPNCGGLKIKRSTVKYCRKCVTKMGLRLGEKSTTWKGGRKLNHGYIMVYIPMEQRNHYKVDCRGYMPEHRKIWEDTNHTMLPDDWVIHHLNGIKDDNRPENLYAMPRYNHNKNPQSIYEPFRLRIRQLEKRLSELNSISTPHLSEVSF